MKKGIVAILSALIGAVVGAVGQGYLKDKTIKEKAGKVDKFKSYYNMLNQWLLLKQEGKSLEQYFITNNITSIAIYGMGEMGNRLFDELKDTNIEVKYAIDKNSDNTYSEVEVVGLEDELQEVDAIIVTVAFVFDEIEATISEVTDMKIISLEEVVFGV